VWNPIFSCSLQICTDLTQFRLHMEVCHSLTPISNFWDPYRGVVRGFISTAWLEVSTQVTTLRCSRSRFPRGLAKKPPIWSSKAFEFTLADIRLRRGEILLGDLVGFPQFYLVCELGHFYFVLNVSVLSLSVNWLEQMVWRGWPNWDIACGCVCAKIFSCLTFSVWCIVR